MGQDERKERAAREEVVVREREGCGDKEGVDTEVKEWCVSEEEGGWTVNTCDMSR